MSESITHGFGSYSELYVFEYAGARLYECQNQLFLVFCDLKSTGFIKMNFLDTPENVFINNKQ